MSDNDKEIRLDREADEERKSDAPLGDNQVKPTTSPSTNDGVGDYGKTDSDRSATNLPEGNPDNANTEGIP